MADLHPIQEEMKRLETSSSNAPIGEFLHKLTGFDGTLEQFEALITMELDRVILLYDLHYSEFVHRTPQAIAGIAFSQGITFAVASHNVREQP